MHDYELSNGNLPIPSSQLSQPAPCLIHLICLPWHSYHGHVAATLRACTMVSRGRRFASIPPKRENRAVDYFIYDASACSQVRGRRSHVLYRPMLLVDDLEDPVRARNFPHSIPFLLRRLEHEHHEKEGEPIMSTIGKEENRA